MLRAVIVLHLLAVALSGCIADPDPMTPGPGTDDPPATDEGNRTSPWFDVVAANGTHPQTGHPLHDDDLTYVLRRSYTWDHLDLSVLIVGPDMRLPSGGASLHGAMLQAIALWKDAIDTHGPPRLRGNITFDIHYSPHVPPTTHTTYDIVITWFQPSGGFAMYAGEMGLPHVCPISTPTDYAYMTDMTWRTAYLVAAHEFGHCLGMSHPDGHCPWQDLLSYDHQCPTQGREPGIPHAFECVSTLNLAILDHSFAPAFGETGEDSIDMHPTDYWIHDCVDAVTEAGAGESRAHPR